MSKSIKYLSEELKLTIKRTKEVMDELGLCPTGYSHSTYQVPTYDDDVERRLKYHVYNKNIDWYSDNCKERLDLQERFSRKYRTWVCKKCGYKNIIDYTVVDWK